MERKEYNGWTNRETWLVNVWFNPESVNDVEMAQETLEEAYDNTPTFLRDFIALSEINWDELKAHFADEDSDEEAEARAPASSILSCLGEWQLTSHHG